MNTEPFNSKEAYTHLSHMANEIENLKITVDELCRCSDQEFDHVTGRLVHLTFRIDMLYEMIENLQNSSPPNEKLKEDFLEMGH